jgi:hypothetical protein
MSKLINSLREYTAELLYISIMPLLIRVTHATGLLYMGGELQMLYLITALFSFAFPNLSACVNLALASINMHHIYGYNSTYMNIIAEFTRQFNKIFHGL